MGKCELCGKEIDDKYKFCVTCNQKLKEDQKDRVFSDNSDIIKAIGSLNNNLYCIRTQLAVMLHKNFKIEVYWDSESKSFKERKVKK